MRADTRSNDAPQAGALMARFGNARFRLQSVLILAMALAFVLSTLTVALGTFYAMAEAEQRMEEQAMEGHSAVWRQTLAAEFQRLRGEVTGITRDALLIEALATEIDVGPFAAPKYNRLGATGVVDRLVVMDDNGQIVFDSHPVSGQTSLLIGQSSLDNGRFQQGVHHTASGTHYAALAVPLYRSGNPVGSVVLLKDLTSDALSSLARATGAKIALLDSTGMRSTTTPDMQNYPLGEVNEQISARRLSVDGGHRLMVHLPVIPFGADNPTANVLVVQDITDSVAAQRLINTSMLVAAVLVLTLIAGALYLGLRGVLQPLRKAVETLDDVGQGRFDSDIRPDSPILEIATLQQSAQGMVRRLRRMLEVEENARLAFRDSLTQLPNRRLLLERLGHVVDAIRGSDANAALILIDLDHFKILNDTRGHSIGDRLLIIIGERLSATIRPCDTLARLGGDEFVILLERLNADREQARAEARKFAEVLMQRIGKPVPLGEIEHVVSASIGITLFPQADDSAEELLKQVDFAMYQAKHQGRDGIRFYDPELQSQLQRQADLERHLRRALLGNMLELHLQPQVDAAGRIYGAEALMRWPDPDGTYTEPSEFIRVAELTGQVVTLGQFAMLQACRTLRHWSGVPALMDLSIAVNCSAEHISQPSFLEKLDAILAETGAPAERLHIELTESVMVDYSETLMTNLAGLRARGIGLAMDDFGTGYSSLSYLKQLPLDWLKIDRSFVADIEQSPDDASIVQTIIAIASLMGLGVIAEGVETAAQREFLVRHGCQRFQGYFFHDPMPVDAFESLVVDVTVGQRSSLATGSGE